ncbi:unnamed protein product, partial [Didymodactylos carnosus]
MYDRVQSTYDRVRQVAIERSDDLVKIIKSKRDSLLKTADEHVTSTEMNLHKYKSDLGNTCTLIDERLKALMNGEDFVRNSQVEHDIDRLIEESNKRLDWISQQNSIVMPVFVTSAEFLMKKLYGELKFRSISQQEVIKFDCKTENGSQFLLSIPKKTPVWTISLKIIPYFLCFYSNVNPQLFVCDRNGVLNVYSHKSLLTDGTPRLLRTIHLFRKHYDVVVESFSVYTRLMIVHTRLYSQQDFGTIFFFTHDGLMEIPGIELSRPLRQFLADDNTNRLWGIDRWGCTIFSHKLPSFSYQIIPAISLCENYIEYKDVDNFDPLKIATNKNVMAVLGKGSQTINIYDKQSKRLMTTGQFDAGKYWQLWNLLLFKDNRLLLKFDNDNAEYIKRSIFIEFDKTGVAVNKIETQCAIQMTIGPNNEIVVGFRNSASQNDRGAIRCYI